jgi:alpha-galactosidase
MKALADHLHNIGLKFGVYSARCRYTCQLFAASFGHEVIDAQQWAEWGVDYLKMDECYGAVKPPSWTGWDDKGVKPTRTDGSCHDLDPDPIHRLGVMRDALNASGRHIFFSNEYPAAHENYPSGVYNLTWMAETHGAAMGAHANMWRISQDIEASWHSILNNIDFDEIWAEFAQPGSINDPGESDMRFDSSAGRRRENRGEQNGKVGGLHSLLVGEQNGKVGWVVSTVSTSRRTEW